MKRSTKILSVLLCGLVMAGCAANKTAETDNSETEVSSSVETTSAETTAAVTSATTEAPVTTVTEDKNKVIFTNPKEPEDPIEFKGEGKKLLVYQNGEKIAEVISDHEVESTPEGRYEDFNFDGHEDLFLYDTPSEFRHYGGECWLWDGNKGEFVKTDKLDGLFGFGIDTEFSDKKIKLTYTEHYNYASSYVCKAEFKWEKDNIIPVSLEKTADCTEQTDRKTEKGVQYSEFEIDEVYEFDQKNRPVLKSRTHAKKYGDRENEEGNEADLRYFRITSDSVQCMNGDSVVQNIPLKNGPELISQYRMRKFRSSDYPLYFNDLVFSVDYDYDGYKDLCVTSGVNEYGMADKFIYYHYDPDTGMVNEWDELNNVFDGKWICSEESHRFNPADKYYNYKPREEYSKLSYDKYIPTGSGEYLETSWYVWNNGKLEPDNTDVSANPLSITNSYFMFNAPADGTSPGPKSSPTMASGDGADLVIFNESVGLLSTKPADNEKTMSVSGYKCFSAGGAIAEMTYIPSGYSHEISDGKLIVKTPQSSQTITDEKFGNQDRLVYADFNFDGYADFYICDKYRTDGYYYLWNPETGLFERSKELEFYGEPGSTERYFLEPDYESRTLKAYFPRDDYDKESITLRWEDGKLVPVSAVFIQYSRVEGHIIAKKCHYKYDSNHDMILTGTEETVYEVCRGTDRITLVYRKKDYEEGSSEKYLRFTDSALQLMKGSSIIQLMSYSDIFGMEPEHEFENVIPGDKISGRHVDYAELDIDFDGTDDLCIRASVERPDNKGWETFYSYYVFDKSTEMYRKWNSISEKGYLYLPDYKEKILYYKTVLSHDEETVTYNYHKWENEQDVIWKQETTD
ncbi:MAG: hypothetical protein IJL67_15250 [Oscillospiraceae bacterium]|nr:hypothetical protein [Oscillospiraceae bacterium]